MKIELFSIALDVYLGQYEGLLPRLQRYEDDISARLQSMKVKVVRGGMVDNVSKSPAAASLFPLRSACISGPWAVPLTTAPSAWAMWRPRVKRSAACWAYLL